jgi:hypothetical protein
MCALSLSIDIDRSDRLVDVDVDSRLPFCSCFLRVVVCCVFESNGLF